MDNKILNFEYSIFGNFNMIFNNAQKLVEMFGDTYTPEVEPSPFDPRGIYTLKSEALGTIKVMSNRIDVFFGVFNNKSLKIFEGILENFFENYKEQFGINRIAINLSFYNNENYNVLLKNLISKINFMDADNPVELNFNINDQCKINELTFNNIVYVQKRILQNSKDFSKFDAIIFGFDFNSLNCKEYENSFNSENTITFFEELQEKLAIKVETLFKKIEEGIYEK